MCALQALGREVCCRPRRILCWLRCCTRKAVRVGCGVGWECTSHHLSRNAITWVASCCLVPVDVDAFGTCLRRMHTRDWWNVTAWLCSLCDESELLTQTPGSLCMSGFVADWFRRGSSIKFTSLVWTWYYDHAHSKRKQGNCVGAWRWCVALNWTCLVSSILCIFKMRIFD